MTMQQNREMPWVTFIFNDDRPWVCPGCYRCYRDSGYEDRAVFQIGLSGAASACPNRTPIQSGDPPVGAVCRRCWKPAQWPPRDRWRGRRQPQATT